MQAIQIRRFGGPAVLQQAEIPPPTPGSGEVLVEVHAASVNPVDAKIRAGKFPGYHPQLPAVLGRDVAGYVRHVGKRVSRFKVGDAVFGMVDYSRGAYAQFIVAAPSELAHRPESLPEREASTLGVAALTAWQGLFDHGHLRRGQRVLIHGAAGGVGHFAVQFAKVAGAFVVATAGEDDLSWIRSLGADRTIDFRKEKFENETGNIDLVYDLIGGEVQDRSWQVLKDEGGRLVSTLQPPKAITAKRHRAVGQHMGQHMVVQPNPKQLSRIAALVTGGRVRVEISHSLGLARTREAHELLENGHVRGKIVLEVPH